MRAPRRACLRATTASLLAAALPPRVANAAETWRIIVPFPPGGSNDQAARVLADRLRLAGGVTIVVENLPGANGNLGAATVARAPADGLTMLLGSDGYATVNPILFRAGMTYQPSDLVAVAIVGFQPALLVVNDTVKARTFKEFVAGGRQTEINYASGGIGSLGHLTMAWLADVSGAKLIHVPHQGGAPAMASLLGGHVQAGFVAIPNALPHVRSGKLRAMAVSSPARLKQLPDVPTVAESGFPGFETQIATIVAVPSATPRARRDALSKAVLEAAAVPEYQAFLEQGGFVPAALDEAASEAWLAREAARWKDLIVARKIAST
jgi:tripartite-type tricarboxylate transporter receptor subunit TctC